jgi:hypothetical protein
VDVRVELGGRPPEKFKPWVACVAVTVAMVNTVPQKGQPDQSHGQLGTLEEPNKSTIQRAIKWATISPPLACDLDPLVAKATRRGKDK